MPKIAAAVWVIRNRPEGDETLVALRRAQSLSQPGFWTFVGEPLSAEDEESLEGAIIAPSPEGALSRALERAGQRALALHAGLWPMAARSHITKEALAAARRRLLVREATFVEVLQSLGVSPAQLIPLEPIGLWRTPPYLARPIDIALFMLRLPPETHADIDGSSFSEGAFVETRTCLRQWQTGERPLGALEAEVLRLSVEAQQSTGEASRAGRPFRSLWAERHPQLDDVFVDSPRRHRPSVQTPHIEAFPVRSPTLAPATHTNCYAVGRERVAVIDPGTPYAEEQPHLVAWLEERQARGSTIEQVWITHHHADHTGAANLLRERFGARVMAHEHTAKATEGVVCVDEFIEDEQTLALGDVSYKSLFTPGHAAGHLCFFDPTNKHLFSGDNVLGTGTSIVVPSPHGDMSAYMMSLERILALDARLLFPGHGPPTARALDRILDTLRQRQARERRLIELLAEAKKPLDVETLLARLYRGIAPAQRKLAALSLRAHVEKLVADHVVAWQPPSEGPPTLALC